MRTTRDADEPMKRRRDALAGLGDGLGAAAEEVGKVSADCFIFSIIAVICLLLMYMQVPYLTGV
jgi:hypothetical protein